jgi:transglutaminase-like putative cysteine protease
MQPQFPSALLRPAFLVLLSTLNFAQKHEMINGDFEGDRVGEVPRGWHIPKPCADAGYGLEVTETSAAGGKHSAALSGTGGDTRMFGNCMQSVDATPYRGKRLRLSAAVWCEPADDESRAQLWFRVDRPGRQMGFFDNMDDRPIRSGDWQRYEIVGNIAEDAEAIALGMMLIGGGTAMLDDVVLEVTDDKAATTGIYGRTEAAPGVAVAAYAAKAHVLRDTQATTFRFPLPLAYRDQTPLTFRLQLEPADVDASVEITAGPGPNRVLELELRNVQREADLTLRYESVVLVGPSSFATVPAEADFPAQWPEEVSPWLEATWCCDSEDERIKAIGAELRSANADVKAVVNGVLRRSQEIFQKSNGRARDLTAVEALDKQGSCTSCANLVTALLRAAGVPARILSGYPLWSGPLQTHYIVEAFVPGYGWYPVESTLGQGPWPNHQQINVSIVPIEHEDEEVAQQRGCAAGAVPFMTLTEHATDSPISWEGMLKPYCDHEGKLLRPVEADAAEWEAAQDWGRVRWAKWLESKPEIHSGKVEFGPASDALAAKTLAELRLELR